MSHDVPVVFIVDDDISVRESLELLVQSAGWRAELFPTARAFLEKPRVGSPSCLILDLNLPDLNGLDLQQLVCNERNEISVIVLTGFGDVPASVRAMKAGAIEFLMKPFSDEILIDALHAGLQRSLRIQSAAQQAHAVQVAYDALSRREREVMALVVAGRLNKQIGFDLGISEITVKAHRGQVMRKMKARSLPDLVNMAARLGIGT